MDDLEHESARLRHGIEARDKQLARLSREIDGLRSMHTVYHAYFGYLLREVKRIPKREIAQWISTAQGMRLSIRADDDYYHLEMVKDGEDCGPAQPEGTI